VHHKVWGGPLDEKDAAGSGKASLFSPRGAGRMWVGLGLLVVFALLAEKTMDPGKLRTVVLFLLGFFAVRILLTAFASR
jgi:hypothetical protein